MPRFTKIWLEHLATVAENRGRGAAKQDDDDEAYLLLSQILRHTCVGSVLSDY